MPHGHPTCLVRTGGPSFSRSLREGGSFTGLTRKTADFRPEQMFVRHIGSSHKELIS
jgi:hypothetical protein